MFATKKIVNGLSLAHCAWKGLWRWLGGEASVVRPNIRRYACATGLTEQRTRPQAGAEALKFEDLHNLRSCVMDSSGLRAHSF